MVDTVIKILGPIKQEPLQSRFAELRQEGKLRAREVQYVQYVAHVTQLVQQRLDSHGSAYVQIMMNGSSSLSSFSSVNYHFQENLLISNHLLPSILQRNFLHCFAPMWLYSIDKALEQTVPDTEKSRIQDQCSLNKWCLPSGSWVP